MSEYGLKGKTNKLLKKKNIVHNLPQDFQKMMETSFLSETTVLQTENNVHYYTMTKHVHKIVALIIAQGFVNHKTATNNLVPNWDF